MEVGDFNNMPSISMFYGIMVSMQFSDNNKRHIPHIHVKYAEYEASFCIRTREILAGHFPPKQTSMVQAWIAIHNDELVANWHYAVNNKTVYNIDPLK